MSRVIRSSAIVIIVLVCFAVSIAVAKDASAPRECEKVDYQTGIALNECSWKETGKWFLEVVAINESNDDKNFGIKCSPDTSEKIAVRLGEWTFDASPGSTFRFSFTFDSNERPELTCKLSSVKDGYSDESPDESPTAVYREPMSYEQSFKAMWERWGGPSDEAPAPGELSKPYYDFAQKRQR